MEAHFFRRWASRCGLRWIVVFVTVLSIVGCGASMDPLVVQKALDDARLSFDRATSAGADSDAPSYHRRARRLLDVSLRQQQERRYRESYYLARRSHLTSDLARAIAEETRARRRVEELQQRFVEAQLKSAALAAETADVRRQIAEIHRARAEAEAAAAREDAANARTEAKRTRQEADTIVARTRAETEMEKARLLLDLAAEARAETYDPDGYARASELLAEADALMKAGDYRAARLKAADAYKAASDTRITARNQFLSTRTKTSLERFRQAVEAAEALGEATAYVALAAKAGAARYAKDDYEAANEKLEAARSARASESFTQAVELAREARQLAEKARAAAELKRTKIREARKREEQIAQIKDQLFRVKRLKERLDSFATTLSREKLESVDGLSRQAENLLEEGKIDLAETIATRAETIVREAEEYAKQVREDEAALVEATKGLDHVQVFTTGRGVVLRVTGDLFAVGRSDLNKSFYPTIAKIAEAIRPFAERYAIVVEGHTDRSGNPDTNLRLSKERAASFTKRLREALGAASVQIRSTGFGSRQLISGINPTDARNRRIEIVILTRQRP